MEIERSSRRRLSSRRKTESTDRQKAVRKLRRQAAPERSRSERASKSRSERADRVRLSPEIEDSEGSERVKNVRRGLAQSFGLSGSSETGGVSAAGSASVGEERGAEGFFDFLPFVGDDDDSRLAEDRDENATVAVIDYFAEDGEEPGHGDLVESILQDTHGDLKDEDIQRYRAGGGGNINDVVEADADEFGDALDGYIEDRVTGLLDGSSAAFEDILDQDDSKIRTVNQSLGLPDIRIAQDLYRRFEEDGDFRDRFTEYAGLESGAGDKEVLQALVDEVIDSRRSNETIRESQERYDELTAEARERGITTVVSAGNYGRFADTLAEHGVEADDEFFNDVLVNDHTLSVGAIDDHGTSTTSDDTEASLTTPHAAADLSANGVGVSTTLNGEVHSGNGTSFSAPQVSGAPAALAERYPNLSPQHIESILEATAQDNMLDMDEIGAGTLDFERALKVAGILSERPAAA